uniref:Secreted protein n=1 Tax=Rhabditophanes sp. KR3021 TaxID=114890 RepID=A0AC35UCC3_9BILA
MLICNYLFGVLVQAAPKTIETIVANVETTSPFTSLLGMFPLQEIGSGKNVSGKVTRRPKFTKSTSRPDQKYAKTLEWTLNPKLVEATKKAETKTVTSKGRSNRKLTMAPRRLKVQQHQIQVMLKVQQLNRNSSNGEKYSQNNSVSDPTKVKSSTTKSRFPKFTLNPE